MAEYLTVTKLNQYIKSVLESDFPLMNITLVGEVSTLTKHYTGHFYFTLKDESSQVKCMMFSSYASKVDFDLKNGDLILIQGYVGVYDKGGTYQVYCRKISLFGEGQYLIQLAKLKQKLLDEGLFSREKRPLPLLPRKIGLITAKNGAAVCDYISTVKSRMNVEIILFPCLVQGEDAPSDIIRAIKETKKYDLDLVVITRGGGSKEDLRCFNDEKLVREAFNLEIPLISAVGHQIDTTLIDYVADKVCITPTDAANNSVPLKDDLLNMIKNLDLRAYSSVNHYQRILQEKVMLLTRNVDAYSPLNKLKNKANEINITMKNLSLIMVNKMNSYSNQMQSLNSLVESNLIRKLKNYNVKLEHLNSKITILNPYSILNNGYGMVSTSKGEIVSKVEQLNINDEIYIRLSNGVVKAIIVEKEK